MKTLYILLIGLLVSGSVISQSCLPEGIVFGTQAQIDNFQNNYPNCTEILGDVLIWENSNGYITNLNELSMLVSIGGDLVIKSNDVLTNLSGLENLTYIGGELEIGDNHSLSSLTGLEGLTSITGDLRIFNNYVLTTLAGLENLTYIGGKLEIGSNHSLSSLTGLEGFTSITGDLRITNNDALINLSGLDNIFSVGGDLFLTHNDSLSSLAGLDNVTTVNGGLIITNSQFLTALTELSSLTFIDGFLIIRYTAITNFTGLDNLTSYAGNIDIHDNHVLNSMVGLDNIDKEGIDKLYIFNNPSLSTCDATWLCDYLEDPNGSIKIYNNATGCDDPSEIAHTCGITLPCLPFGHYYFTSQINIDDFPSNFPGCVELKGDVKIFDSDEITNVNGLNQVTSIEGTLDFLNNEALTSLTGFENLTYIGALGPHKNNSLTSLEGLDNVDGYSLGYLYIGYNSLLSTCGIQSICNYLSVPNNEAFISGNNTGCSNLIEVEQACGIFSVDELNNIQDPRIYPNPTQSTFTIELPTLLLKNTFLILSNSNGQQLITQPITEPQTVVDVSGLPSGVYFVKVMDDEKVMMGKVIKE